MADKAADKTADKAAPAEAKAASGKKGKGSGEEKKVEIGFGPNVTKDPCLRHVPHLCLAQ